MKKFLHKTAYLLGATLILLAVAFYFFSKEKKFPPIASDSFQPRKTEISNYINELETVGFADTMAIQKAALKEALVIFKERNFVEAEKKLNELINNYPNHLEAKYYLGLSYLYQEKKTKARKTLTDLSTLPEFELKEDAEWFALLASIDHYKKESLAHFQKIAASDEAKYQQAAATILASFQLTPGTFSFQQNEAGEQQFVIVLQSENKWWTQPPVRMSLLFLLPIGGLSLIFWKQRVKEINKVIIAEEVASRTAKIRAEKDAIKKEHELSEELLNNILPSETAEELKKHGQVNTRRHENATVLFCDFKGFTNISEQLTPEELVKNLGIIFEAFDRIIEKNQLEKIKTVGDCYICAGGLKNNHPNQAGIVVYAALEMISFLKEFNNNQSKRQQPLFEGRIGINTGPVVAGIVGIKKYAYDIWGDTVNLAARMEQASQTGKINISGSTFDLVKHEFEYEPRGKVTVKGKGAVDMFFIKSAKKN
ncbi:MAG: adenylate/guanylate cyclase domain-containing protein [Bacteroidota bacterium]